MEKLARWFTAAAQSASGRVNVLVLGDSITEGTTLANQDYEAWPAVLGRLIAGSSAGMGYVPAAYANGASAWELSGSPSLNVGTASYRGLGRRSVTLAGSQSASYGFYGTNFALYFTKTETSGAMGISVDGGQAVSVSTTANDGELNSQRYVPAGLVRGWHVVTVNRISGGSVVLEGGAFWDNDFTSGITMWNGAHTGINSAFFVGSDDRERWAAMVDNIQPALVLIAIGTNDASAQEVEGIYGPTIYGERIRSIVNLVRDHTASPPAFVLLQQPQPPSVDPTYWARHMDALQAVADSEPDVTTVDLRPVVPSGPGALYNDALHPNAAGARLYAMEIARQLHILPTAGPKILSGTARVRWTAVSFSAALTPVTFPVGYFTSPPALLVSRASFSTTAPEAFPYPGSVSTTGATVGMTTGKATQTYPTGTSVNVNWVAVGQ